MSGHVGWDPYTTAASDVYQDLFHEGSYVGKGIYDPRAFHAALAGRVPTTRLLSHDLFEGFFARAGLVADVHLVDDFPSHYLTWSARLHRWARGDWQIAGWLGRTVVNADGARVRNPLPVLARWKILDNLRRSLLSPSLVLLLALGWTVLPGSAFTWTLLSLLVLAYPAYLRLGESLNSRVRGVPFGPALAQPAGRPHGQRTPGAADRDVSRAPVVGDGRRHRPHAVADAGEPPAPARMGIGIGCGSPPEQRRRRRCGDSSGSRRPWRWSWD